MEAYRARTGLTQCYNCQQFGHVWANCKQPPRCLWCGGDHCHKECPEKENNNSSPSCCNCKLTEGERPHPANFRGSKLAKEEMLRRKSPPLHPKMWQDELSPPGLPTRLRHTQPPWWTTHNKVTQASQPNRRMPQGTSNKQHTRQPKHRTAPSIRTLKSATHHPVQVIQSRPTLFFERYVWSSNYRTADHDRT